MEVANEMGTAEPELTDLTQDVGPYPFESDPCYRVLGEHLPKWDPPPEMCSIPLGSAFWNGCRQAVLWTQLESMHEFLHMRPKRIRGRPEGSGLKEHTAAAFELWKEGMTPSEICRALEIPQAERGRLAARNRSTKRRLPEDERQAAVRAAWSSREARKATAGRPGS
jgi:hypothetical protein